MILYASLYLSKSTYACVHSDTRVVSLHLQGCSISLIFERHTYAVVLFICLRQAVSYFHAIILMLTHTALIYEGPRPRVYRISVYDNRTKNCRPAHSRARLSCAWWPGDRSPLMCGPICHAFVSADSCAQYNSTSARDFDRAPRCRSNAREYFTPCLLLWRLIFHIQTTKHARHYCRDGRSPVASTDRCSTRRPRRRCE